MGSFAIEPLEALILAGERTHLYQTIVPVAARRFQRTDAVAALDVLDEGKNVVLVTGESG